MQKATFNCLVLKNNADLLENSKVAFFIHPVVSVLITSYLQIRVCTMFLVGFILHDLSAFTRFSGRVIIIEFGFYLFYFGKYKPL